MAFCAHMLPTRISSTLLEAYELENLNNGLLLQKVHC